MAELFPSILAGGLGGFLAWSLGHVAAYFVIRRRLKTYLITLINTHLSNLHASSAWLESVREKTLLKGRRVETAADYTPGDVDYIQRHSDLMLRYLTRRELLLLSKCTQAIWEVEALFKGLSYDLTNLKKNKAVLNEGLIDHLKSKISRIRSYIEIFPDKVEDISALPEDYRGVLPPETLVA